MQFPNGNSSVNSGSWAENVPWGLGLTFVGAYALYKYITSPDQEAPPARPLRPRVKQAASLRQDAAQLKARRERLFDDPAKLAEKMQRAYNRANQDEALSAVSRHRPKHVNLDLMQDLVLAETTSSELQGRQLSSVSLDNTELKLNEDRCRSGEIQVGKQRLQFSVVLDGHGGGQSSIYCAKRLQEELQQQFALHAQDELTDCAIANALTQTFVKLSDGLQAKDHASGTTVNLVLHVGDRTWCANAGDSRAILVTENGQLQALSEDALTSSDYWKKSPNKYGARIRYDRSDQIWRINDVGIARTIGCYEKHYVSTPRPKLTVIDAPKSGYRIIQASDGLWDAISSQETAEQLKGYRGVNGELAARLAAVARHAVGSSDDITVLVTQSPHHG